MEENSIITHYDREGQDILLSHLLFVFFFYF